MMVGDGDVVTRRATATLLAALRMWQLALEGTLPQPEALLGIATDGGALVPLTAAEIDDMCEAINCPVGHQIRVEIAQDSSPVLRLLREAIALMPLGTAKHAQWISRAVAVLNPRAEGGAA